MTKRNETIIAQFTDVDRDERTALELLAAAAMELEVIAQRQPEQSDARIQLGNLSKDIFDATTMAATTHIRACHLMTEALEGRNI